MATAQQGGTASAALQPMSEHIKETTQRVDSLLEKPEAVVRMIVPAFERHFLESGPFAFAKPDRAACKGNAESDSTTESSSDEADASVEDMDIDTKNMSLDGDNDRDEHEKEIIEEVKRGLDKDMTIDEAREMYRTEMKHHASTVTVRYNVADAEGNVQEMDEVIMMEEYLGKSWCDHILNLHSIVPDPEPETMYELRDFQRKAARQGDYLCRSEFRAMILGDAMGVGKTRTCIKIMELARNDPGCFSLVVCPKTLQAQWAQEIRASYKPGCMPSVYILDDRRTTASELHAKQCDIVIVSYEFLEHNARPFTEWPENKKMLEADSKKDIHRPVVALHSSYWISLGLPIKRLILDECQKIKNEEGMRHVAVKHLYFHSCILVSGTILDNTSLDCAALIVSFVRGHPFYSTKYFTERFTTRERETYDLPMQGPSMSQTNVAQLARFLNGFMIARPSTVLHLEGLKAYSVEFDLNQKERKAVKEHVRAYLSSIARRKGSDGESMMAFTHSIRAQQAAAHEKLFQAGLMNHNNRLHEFVSGEDGSIDQEEDKTEHAASSDAGLRDQWIATISENNFDYHSSRIDCLLATYRYCREAFPDEKMLIFGEFLSFLDLLAQAFKRELSIECLRFDGSCSAKQREDVKTKFAGCDPEVPLLITGRAGGLGLNLQTASIVVQTEVWWNHNWELQAYFRAYRQGQTHEVKVFRLLARNSEIDHIILRRQREKSIRNSQIMRSVVRRHDEIPSIPIIKHPMASLPTL